MKIIDKKSYAEKAIESISRHDDMDLAVRLAALEALKSYIDAEIVAANGRVQEKIATEVGV